MKDGSRRIIQVAATACVAALVAAAFVAPAGAHVAGVRHLFNNHIKPKLATPGTINDASNPVDWSKLKNVPADFADGTDAVGSGPGGAGDITAVLTGSGLSGGGSSGDVTLSADTAFLQRRVTPCAAGQAINAIGPDGTSTCIPVGGGGGGGGTGDITGVTAGSGLTGGGAAGEVSLSLDPAFKAAGYSGYKNSPGTATATARNVGTLSLPAGNYLIFAKINVTNSVASTVLAECELAAGGDTDRGVAGVDSGTPGQTIAMNVAHAFAGAGQATVTCRTLGVGGTVNLGDLKISAIRFPDAVSNVALP